MDRCILRGLVSLDPPLEFLLIVIYFSYIYTVCLLTRYLR